MKKHIICGRPLSPRELAWNIVTLVALLVALGTLIWYPLVGAVALGAFVLAALHNGFFRRIKKEFRRFIDYRLYHSLSR